MAITVSPGQAAIAGQLSPSTSPHRKRNRAWAVAKNERSPKAADDPVDRRGERKRNPLLLHSRQIISGLNIFYMLCGSGVIAVAVYVSVADGGIYARMFQTGTGTFFGAALAGMGAVVWLTAVLGQLGVMWGNRCLLTTYFVLLFSALVVMLALASTVLNNTNDLEATGDKWWDSFSEDLRGDVQDEFSCCGFLSSGDRPAGDCEEEPLPEDGCVEVAMDEWRDKAIPAYMLGLLVSVALLLSLVLTSYILCRRSGRLREAPGIHGVSNWNKPRLGDGFDFNQANTHAELEPPTSDNVAASAMRVDAHASEDVSKVATGEEA
ncbi:unnamed protein product [Discosporangium mesarthrocarpum]